jgi:ketosteroid isomerase-like protein
MSQAGMTRENVDLARRMVEWFNALDAGAAQAHSTDDVEIVPLRAAMEGTTYRGPEAFAAFLSDTEEAWEEIRFDPESFREAAHRVVAIGQLSARARVTGAGVNARVALLIEYREGRVSRLRTYTDVDEAVEAAGLRAQ